ncbi:MAG: NAD(P)/FAD-dependent oxidoreductase [Bacteroidales bacterium]
MTDKKPAYDLHLPHIDRPRVVVIGGGFGGINLIKHLDSRRFEVVLLDRYNYHTFQPLLYQVATSGLEPDSIAGPLRKIFRRKPGFHFRMLKVHKVEPDQNRVVTTAGPIPYDYLVIATGSSVNFFQNKSLAQHAYPVKQLTHALDLRSEIFQQLEQLTILQRGDNDEALYTFVVVGGGPTGVEICGALSELRKKVLPADYQDMGLKSIHIYLVEGEERVLPQMSEESGRKAMNYLERMGVEVLLNTLTNSYDGSTVKLNNGREIKSKTVIWAAGVKANSIGGLPEGSYTHGKIRVNGINRVLTGGSSDAPYENIFAIGDVALMESSQYPKGLPGLAPVAIQQGKQLARNLAALEKKKPTQPFSYRDRGVMATIGRNRAVGDFPWGLRLSGFAGWFAWMVSHLIFLIGFRNKAVVLINWIWNYFTYDRGIRLIIRPSPKEKDPISKEMAGEMEERETVSNS